MCHNTNKLGVGNWNQWGGGGTTENRKTVFIQPRGVNENSFSVSIHPEGVTEDENENISPESV